MNTLKLLILSGFLILFSSQILLSQDLIMEQFFQGDYGQVVGMASESLAEGDTSFTTFFYKAQSEVQMGQVSQAINTLKMAENFYPSDKRIQGMLARQYYMTGDYLKAQETYRYLVKTDSTDISSWLKLAEISNFSQQYDEAHRALTNVLIIDSLNLQGLMLMGELLNRLRDSTAVSYYEKALYLYPDNQQAAFALGNLYIQSNKPRSAIPLCEKMLEIDSTNIKFRKLMGFAYYKSGGPRKAIGHYKTASELGDSSLFTFKYMGICEFLAFEYTDAIASLQVAALKDSMDAEIHFFLGASLAQTKEKKKAFMHLDWSLQLMQPDPSVVSRIYSEKGYIKRLEEEYELAFTLYEMAWEADTTNPLALYFMASIKDNSLHQSEVALVIYRRFISQLDKDPITSVKNEQIPSLRDIVEDRIISIKEELFFLDNN